MEGYMEIVLAIVLSIMTISGIWAQSGKYK
jgi:hypothetical protein